MRNPKHFLQLALMLVSPLIGTVCTAQPEKTEDTADVFILPELMRFRAPVTEEHGRNIGCRYLIKEGADLSNIKKIISESEIGASVNDNGRHSYFIIVDLNHGNKKYISYSFDVDRKDGRLIGKVSAADGKFNYREFQGDISTKIRDYLYGRNYFINNVEYSHQPCNLK